MTNKLLEDIIIGDSVLDVLESKLLANKNLLSFLSEYDNVILVLITLEIKKSTGKFDSGTKNLNSLLAISKVSINREPLFFFSKQSNL